MRKRLLEIAVGLFIIVLLHACSGDDNNASPGKMILIPEGEFIMGSDEVDTEGYAKEFGMRQGALFENERPERKISLKSFYIDAFEVTNVEYRAFVSSYNYPPPADWNGGVYATGKDLHPVTNVQWYDAANYCVWAGKRLPTEEEWEKAARGPNGNKYPWGEIYDEKAANLSTNATVQVGSYKTDKSPYGVYDMGGNVMEWTESLYVAYPGNKTKSKDYGKGFRVIRGGSGGLPGHYVMSNILARSSSRTYARPEAYGVDTGFRCVKTTDKK